MGFFFILDVVSTASLVLDLPSVQESMASDDGSIQSGSQGKTARLGAKAARVVRIVRLVRIVKLYKILVLHFEKQIDKCMGIKADDDDEFLDLADDEPQKKESRVGKKLSHATLKRVIVLILAMLVVVPSLSASEELMYPVSASYGADGLVETFSAMQHGTIPRLFYEQSMLRFIYYHNWFNGRDDGCPGGSVSCPNDYYGGLFWVGAAGRDAAAVDAIVEAANIRLATVQQWEHNVTQRRDIYKFGAMPAVVQSALGSAWVADCTFTRSDGIREYMKGVSLLANNAGGKVSHKVACPIDLRSNEVDRYYPRLVGEQTAKLSHFVFFFDQRRFLKTEATFGIIVTVYVCFSLCIAIMFFSRDANRLVLHPVENMIAKVEKIRKDPLAAIRLGDFEFKAEEAARIKKERTAQRLGAGGLGMLFQLCRMISQCRFSDETAVKQPMETMILEKTLIKLGSLLALGLGEAGAMIINANMANSDSANVDVMIPGNRSDCIYAQAQIGDFSVVTEVLQANVMQFVNLVAEIVHGVVIEFLGAPNANTGEKYLLVWRSAVLPNGQCDIDKYADLSVVAFCKILASLQQSPALASYRKHPRLKFLLKKDYRVSLNVGIHAGWAFEGALGSEYKIDASYISPNIALVANLEQASHHFGLPLLVSESVVSICSPGVKEKCRKIDVVQCPGRHEPLGLYTIGLDTERLYVEEESNDFEWNPRARFRARQFLEVEKNRKLSDDNFACRFMHTDPSIEIMRERYTEEFLQTFKMGFENYLEGEWHVSQRLLMDARQILGTPDGPSDSLLAFMHQHDFNAPEDWRGFRDLVPLLNGPQHTPNPPMMPPTPLHDGTKDAQGTKGISNTQMQPSNGSLPEFEWHLPHAVPFEGKPRPLSGKARFKTVD